MPTAITARQFELTEAIKNYIEEKTKPLYRHFDHILAFDVEIDRNMHHKHGNVFHVRMNVDVPNEYLLHIAEEGPDLYATIDICAQEMDQQIKKHKEKMQSRKRAGRNTRRDMKSALSVTENPIEE